MTLLKQPNVKELFFKDFPKLIDLSVTGGPRSNFPLNLIFWDLVKTDLDLTKDNLHLSASKLIRQQIDKAAN